MKKSSRLQSKPRLDYKILNETGERKVIDLVEGVAELSNLFDSMSVSEDMDDKNEVILKALYIELQSISDDIIDFMEENQLDESDISDVDVIVSKAENLRSKYRTTYLQIQASVPDLEQKEEGILYQKIINEIKSFILTNENLRKKIRASEGKAKDMLDRAVNFQINNLKSTIYELRAEIKTNVDEFTDTEI